MNNGGSSSSNPQPPAFSGGDGSGKKVRKPYTVTKSRESWTDEEHDKFLEALQLFDRDWKKIEDFVGSKTVIQIRSHAQKYFLKVQKNGTSAHVPPPRPKRKAAHPYPQKAPKPVLAPLQVSMNPLAPRYPSWDDNLLLVAQPSSEAVPSGKGVNPVEDSFGPSETTGIGNCSLRGFIVGSMDPTGPTLAPPVSSSVVTKQGKEGSSLHGIPNFAEVYSFIGSVFDPDSKKHIIKLKEMDPISFETVLLLMRNLTVNLSSPDFEPIKQVLSSYDVGANHIGVIGAE